MTGRITLDLSGPEPEPEWRELTGGLAFKMRPLRGLQFAAAKARVAEQMEALRAGKRVAEVAGFDRARLGLLGEEETFKALSGHLLACAIALAVVAEWNVDLEPGKPAPITPANVQQLFDRGPPGIVDDFLEAVFESRRRVQADVFPYAGSPSTTTAEPAPIATTAGGSTPPAPAASPRPQGVTARAPGSTRGRKMQSRPGAPAAVPASGVEPG